MDTSSNFDKHAATKNTLAGIGLSIVIVVGLTFTLHWRAANGAATDIREAMPVNTINYNQQDSYNEQAAFLGLVQAAKTTNLGFEVSGIIDQILVEEGSKVKKGDLLARLDNSALSARRDVTKAMQKGTLAELKLAQLQLRRKKNLVAKGSVSRASFDESRLQVEALKAQIESSEAQLHRIDIDLNKSLLVSPYDGAIAYKFVDDGTVVAAGTPIFRVLAEGFLKANIGLGPEQSEELILGNTYTLALRQRNINAKLTALRPDVDPITRTAQAVFTLPAKTRALDGEPIQLMLTQQRSIHGGWLPISAMMEANRGLWSVLRIDDSQQNIRVVREAVEVIAIQGDKAFVVGTLPDGAKVVANGINRITPGSIVSLSPQMEEG